MENLVDVIIPTYKPDNKFLKSINRLLSQTVEINKFIIINTDKAIWDNFLIDDKLSDIIKDKKDKFIIKHIKKEEFDHGKSRNFGASLSSSKYFICMTMDAIPADEYLVENLLSKMSDEIKLTYARQVPSVLADDLESFTRIFNYPNIDCIKRQEDIKKYGIKTYFCSNVCACYEKDTFLKIGGFRENIILNEDMLYARDLLVSKKALEYVSKAIVIHSHNYSGIKQLKRNFDIGVSQAVSKDIFKNLNSQSEGIKLVKESIKYLIAKKKAYLIPKLLYISACKFIGFKLGKSYKFLPKPLVKKISLNNTYFK